MPHSKEKIYFARQRVFIRGTACSLEIYLKPHDRRGGGVVMDDVPKLGLGEKAKREMGKGFLFLGGGGLETNKGRARCPGVVGRSKKVVCIGGA